MNLTYEQLKVINSNAKRILVKAGAGTGKTEVMIRRIVRLLEENPDLSITNMAIITFTNKATEEMQSRLKKALYEKWKYEKDAAKKDRLRYHIESINQAQISTIHKFCESILEQAGPVFTNNIIFSPAFSVQSDLLNETINDTVEQLIKNKNNQGKFIEHLNYVPVHRLKSIIKELYKTIRAKGLNIDRIMKKTQLSALTESDGTVTKLKNELVELLRLVEENHKKYKYNRLDVDDLLEYTDLLLKEQPDLAESIRRKFKYIFVDEFQDTSLYQFNIINTICNLSQDSPDLFVVGDIKQSIYEFRGAHPDSYRKIEEQIRLTGEVLTLTTNWRSTPEIVYYVNKIFDDLKNKVQFKVISENLKSREVKENLNYSEAYEWFFAENQENQGKIVAEYLKRHFQNGVSADQFAVLVRKNYQTGIISKYLDEYQIPYEISADGLFYNQKEIVHINIVLKALLEPDHPVLFQECLETIYFLNDENLLKNVFKIVNNKSLLTKYTPSQLLEFIFRETDIYSRASNKVKANLYKLKEITRQLTKDENISLRQYIDWLSIMIETNKVESLGDYEVANHNRVKIMTIHKAKGLEFPIVILPFLDEEISKTSLNPPVIISKDDTLEFKYNNYFKNEIFIYSRQYEESVKNIQHDIFAEELRVLYVALTRAKNKLIFVGNRNVNERKNCFQNWLTS